MQAEFGPRERSAETDALEYLWKSPLSESPGLDRQILVRFEKGRLEEASLKFQIARETRKELAGAGTTLGSSAQVILGVSLFVGIPLIGLLYIINWIRRSVDHSAALTAGFLTLATGTVVVTVTLARLGANVAGRAWLGVLMFTLFLAPAFAALFGLGLRAARAREWKQWAEMRLLLQRKWRARAIGRSLALGFAASGALAAIPYLVAEAGVFPGASLSQETHFIIVLELSQIGALHPPFEIYSAVFFAFLLPILSRRLAQAWLTAPVFFVAAGFGYLPQTEFGVGITAAAANALLIVAAQYWIYSQFGLLAMLAAVKGSDILLAASRGIDSASADLHVNGFLTLALFAAAWIGCIVWARKGKDLSPDESKENRYLSAREKLKEEFALARQAQQRMLPVKAPETPAFQVASACQPAREVGGDLYDFFRLPDGRLGICVADVSGKGMSAALFMTLTKGILAAASEESSDVAVLARHVNHHLYAACRRRAFVTAVIAALDCRVGTLEFVRAGHNPALWFEAARGEARFLNSRGMGFGLAASTLFDKGTDPARIVLSPGDIVVLYSDGVTEALNENRELYGEERLRRLVEANANGSAQGVLDAVREDLKRFAGAEPPHDDITLVVLQADNGART
jgi:serine phosphatase RsbU (regulator of sigma subunit)